MRYGVLEPGRPAARRDRAARADRVAADRHARPRPRRDARSARATSCRATRSARRCSRCARSCSSASTSARRRAPSTSAPRTTVQRIFDHLVARGDDVDADRRLRRRHDRPVRARLRARLDGCRPGKADAGAESAADLHRSCRRVRRTGQGARRRHASRVVRGAHGDMLRKRTQRGARCARAAARSTRSARRASPSTRRQALLLLRLRQGRRPRSRSCGRSRTSISPARSSGSPTGSTSGSSTRSRRPAEEARQQRGERLHDAARPGGARSTSATSGSRRRAGSRATTSRAAALGEEACREFRLGLALGGTTLARKARREGVHARRAASRPGSSTGARQRLLLSGG